MKISLYDAMVQLSVGELAQFGVANYQQGKVEPEKYKKLLPIIQRGLMRIYNDLEYDTDVITLVLSEDITTYELIPERTYSAGTAPSYIDDMNKPFYGNVHRIDSVVNGSGIDLPINVTNDLDSVAVPKNNIIQFPFPYQDELVRVTYTLSSPKLPEITTEAEAKATVLPLDSYAHDALYLYVLATMTAGITRQQEIQDTEVAMQRYMLEIERIKQHRPTKYDTSINLKAAQRGYV